MERTVVMVTGVGGGGNGEQLLKCLKLAQHNYEIVGGDMSPCSKGLLEVDHPYILPPAGHENYIESVLKVCRRHKVKVIFPGSEPELKRISRERSKFEEENIFLPINPQNVIDICMDKKKTMKWCKEKGFHCPKTVAIRSAQDLEAIDFMPAVLKPSVGGSGSSDVFIVQNQAELSMFGQFMLGCYEEFVAQEYVGTVDSEYTVGVLLDMDGCLINSIAVKRNIMSGLSNRQKLKNKTGNVALGDVLAVSSGISQGDIGRFPEVTEFCGRMAVELGCTGAVNIQCRLVGSKVYVFEINPRFSGTSSLRAMVGYNEPDVLIRKYIFNQDIEIGFSYKEGCIMRGLQESLIDDLNLLEV